MKKLFPLAALAAILQLPASAQTTVTFKPDPSLGDNTLIMTTYGCTPTDQSSPMEIQNAGTTAEVPYIDWTYNAVGCPHGTTRSLLRFNQLSSIPPTATILNAQLNLYGVLSSGNYGNSIFPGSPFTLPNYGQVYQVTSPWSISSVTWNTQPSIGGSPVTIPQSTSRFGWNTSVNVTSMVQSMVSSGINNGFMTRLQTEAYYRSVLFAGNGNSNPALWPELVITYCDASFTYCFSSTNPYLITLTPNSINPGDSYEWMINGAVVGYGAGFSYWLGGPGSYEVCLQVIDEKGQRGCRYCLKLCVADNGRVNQPAEASKPATSNSRTGAAFPTTGNEAVPASTFVSPNPAHDGWNIRINNGKAASGKAEIVIYDINGKEVKRLASKLTAGENVIYQDASGFAAGTYLIEVRNNGVTSKEKVVKE